MRHLRVICLAGGILALPLLSGCAPVLIAGGAAATAISMHDRRSTGTQADDETSEWKGSNRLPAKYRDSAHVNFTAFNRVMLLTGEVPDEEARQAIAAVAAGIEGIRRVVNELAIAAPSSFASRSQDAFVASKFRARVLESNQLSVNHLKSITERGTLYVMGLVNEREARLAIDLARTTDGVRKVVNLLEVVGEAETRQLDAAAFGAPVAR